MKQGAAYFEEVSSSHGETLVPLGLASSGWNAAHVRGPAVSGVLARAAEAIKESSGRDDLRPARWTLDLCAPAPHRPSTCEAQVLKESRRLMLVAAELRCDGRASARATALFLKPTQSPANETWRSDRSWAAPPPGLLDHESLDEPALFASEKADWSTHYGPAQDSTRKVIWRRAVPIVAGERITAFQAAASMGDVASLVVNWGAAGTAHINADVTLAMARLPVADEVGIGAVDRVEVEGIAIGTAAMFDREGTFGTVLVSALANARKQMDLSQRDLPSRSGGTTYSSQSNGADSD